MERTGLRQEGAPCWLRPVSEVDADAIYHAAVESMEHVGKWMSWLTPSYTVSDSCEWARGAAADWEKDLRYEFVIVDAEDGTVCGCCGLNSINRIDLVCNLGYWVRASVLRRGMATTAARLLIKFGLHTLGLKRLEIVVAEGNTASRGVAEKVGAIHEGLQRMRLRVGDTSHDAHMYACLAGEH